MLPHPENSLGIFSVPTAAFGDIEETPCMLAVIRGHEDSHTLHRLPLRPDVFLPDNRQEQRASAVHNGDVRQSPVPLIRRE